MRARTRVVSKPNSSERDVVSICGRATCDDDDVMYIFARIASANCKRNGKFSNLALIFGSGCVNVHNIHLHRQTHSHTDCTRSGGLLVVIRSCYAGVCVFELWCDERRRTSTVRAPARFTHWNDIMMDGQRGRSTLCNDVDDE